MHKHYETTSAEISPTAPTVVFLDQYGSLGGGQQMLLELASSARQASYATTVLIPMGSCANELAAQKTYVVPIEELQLRQGAKRLRDICAWIVYSLHIFLKNRRTLGQANLVYVNGARLLLIGALSSVLLRKKAVYHIHLLHSRAERLLFRLLLKLSLTQAIVVPSDFIRRSFSETDSRIMLVRNGLDKRFSGMAYVDRFKENPLKHVGIVGRVSPEKGQDILLTLAPKFQDMVFHVFGDAAFADATYYENLRNTLPANVVFHGWVDNVAEKAAKQGLQLWIVPSRCAESSSLVTMQGTALSCLIAVREQGALTALAEELCLYSFQSDKEMSRLLEQLRDSDREELSRRTRNSFQRVMEQYGHTAFRKRLVDLFSRLAI
jgi:glycosyltransferase involved in cell wall biosynthesis